MNINIAESFGYETLREDGARVVAGILASADGRNVAEELARAAETMLNLSIADLLKDPKSPRTTHSLARLSGLLAGLCGAAGIPKHPTMKEALS